MTAGYIVDHNLKNDCLGENCTVAEIRNYPNINTVLISYHTNISYCNTNKHTVAIFKIKPKAN